MSDQDCPVCLLQDAWKHGIGICGSKATNLSLMLMYGLPVPNGIVIKTPVYSSLIKGGQFSDELIKYSNHIINHQDLAAEVHEEELNRIFKKIKIPPVLLIELQNIIKSIKLIDTSLIVRSSSISEDGKANSFAGIFESYTDVTLDTLENAILNCYKTVWSYKSVVYHSRLKIQLKDIDFAVIIQQQINADFSGVTFTCEPNNCSAGFYINAFPGQGEQIASGQVNPWNYQIKKDEFHHLSNIQSFKNDSLLGKDRLSMICSISQRVFDSIGNGEIPQDIEWVIKADTIWIVQARPITTLKHMSISKKIRDERIFYSNANLRDILPNAQTPLNWSLMENVLEEMVRTPFLRAFYDKARLPCRTRLINGRAYFNLTLLQWEMYDCFGVNPKEYNAALGGHQPELKISAKATVFEKMQRLNRSATLYVNFAMAAILSKRKCKTISSFCHSKMLSPISKLDNSELSNEIDSLLETIYKFSRHVQLANILAGGIFLAFKSQIKKTNSNINLSATIWKDIAKIVDIVNEEKMLKDIFQSKSTASIISYIDQLSGNCKFVLEWNNFFLKHGHRAVDELEISRPRWFERSDYIVESIASLLSTEKDTAHHLTDATKKNRKQKNGLLQKLAIKIVSFALSMRENSKSSFVQLIWPLRKYYLSAAAIFLKCNIMDAVDDIFFCTYSEVRDILIGKWDGNGLRALIQKRKFDYKINEDASIEDVVEYGCVSNSQMTTTNKNSSEFQGIGVSNGVISAPVRVLKSPNDGGQILPGEIVVTGSASPSWFPYFMKASGFVTEVGGYLSHFSVLAREFGIPAIVNVKGICSTVKTGDVLMIDSSTGQVTIQSKKHE